MLRLTLSLLLLAALFRLIERKHPNRWRRTDLFWWFLTPLFSRLATGAAVVAVCALSVTFRRPLGAAWFRHQPLALQWLELLVGGDLIGYWSHRAFHRRPLWAIHAVHHSSESLDWLAAARVHPLNEILSRTIQVIPFYLLGMDPRVLAGLVPLTTLYAIYLHADVGWDYGPLRYVVASPRFHRWHHTSEDDGLDRNFAGLFPWIDLLFGTFHMPRGREAVTFGVREGVPPGVWGQLAYPFTKKFSSFG
jgi:sterol desaturase/sphingolipid hydroxylase (fatty acid hydroxylase superfamily)